MGKSHKVGRKTKRERLHDEAVSPVFSTVGFHMI